MAPHLSERALDRGGSVADHHAEHAEGCEAATLRDVAGAASRHGARTTLVLGHGAATARARGIRRKARVEARRVKCRIASAEGRAAEERLTCAGAHFIEAHGAF